MYNYEKDVNPELLKEVKEKENLILSMLKVELIKNPYEPKEFLYETSTILLKEGLNIIIGRNGSGKSTFCRSLKEFCNKNKIPCYSYDNYHDGGSTAMQIYLGMNDFESLVSTAFHSEGEQIFYNLGKQIERMSEFIKTHKDSKQLVIILDALDSGLDIEGIEQFKDICDLIVKDNKDKEVYIVATANNYSLIHENQCINIKDGKEYTFTKFEDYRDFILNQYKKERNKEN